MALLAQHGHGKSDRLETALGNQVIEGVIYSPRNERPDNLVAHLGEIATEFPESIRIIDPQFHACVVQNGTVGKLTDYPYFQENLTFRDVRVPSEITRRVTATLGFQYESAVSHICSPTFAIDSLTDRWATLALSFAEESINVHQSRRDERPLLVSLVVSEQALRNEQQLDEYLDTLTELECDGFYVVVSHSAAQFSQMMHADVVAGLMYLIHVLSERNNYLVYVGYSDFVTVLLHAAGVDGTGCGWNSGERRFSMSKFQPRDGGRRPSARYSSRPLLNSILMTPDFDTIAGLRRNSLVHSGTRYDAVFRTSRQPSRELWPEKTSALHHWEVLSALISGLDELPNARSRIAAVENLIRGAIDAYNRLNDVPFSAQTGPSHLGDWLNGLQEFKRRSGQ